MKVTFRNRNFTSLWIAGLVSLIGALLIAQIGQRFSTAQLTTGGLVLSGAFLLVIATMPKLPVGLITLLLLGTSLMAWIVSLQTISSKPRPTSTAAGSSARSVLC